MERRDLLVPTDSIPFRAVLPADAALPTWRLDGDFPRRREMGRPCV